MEEERIVNSEFRRDDFDEFSLRPRSISEYIGQTKVKENLLVFIQAAKERGSPLTMFFIWPSRAWENHTCRSYCKRAWGKH